METTLRQSKIRISTSEIQTYSKTDQLKTIGFILALAANLIWGTSFLASKVTLNFWGPFTASVLRFTIAVVTMLIIFPLLNKSIAIPRSVKAWGKVVLVGISGFGLLYPLQLKGMTEIPSSLSACIMLTAPLFVLLLTTGILKEHLSPWKLTAIAVGIFGGTLLINPANLSLNIWDGNSVAQILKGVLLTLLASLCLAVSVLATRAASKELDIYSLTFWSMVIGLFILLPFALSEEHHLLPPDNPILAFAALIYLALACSVFTFLMWNKAITYSSPQSLASTMHIKTPVAVLAGVCIANEAITAPIILGTALISFAVWLSQQNPKTAGQKS